MFNLDRNASLANSKSLDDVLVIVNNLSDLNLLPSDKFYHNLCEVYPFAEQYDLVFKETTGEQHSLSAVPLAFCSECKVLLKGPKVCQICHHGNDVDWLGGDEFDKEFKIFLSEFPLHKQAQESQLEFKDYSNHHNAYILAFIFLILSSIHTLLPLS